MYSACFVYVLMGLGGKTSAWSTGFTFFISQKDSQTDRSTERERGRGRERQNERGRERHTEIERGGEGERYIVVYFCV